MNRVIMMALAALLWAISLATAFNSTDDVQAPRAVEVALAREEPQAPVRSDEIQAPRHGRGQSHRDEIQAPRTFGVA